MREISNIPNWGPSFQQSVEVLEAFDEKYCMSWLYLTLRVPCFIVAFIVVMLYMRHTGNDTWLS
jgi:hypothetical protein